MNKRLIPSGALLLALALVLPANAASIKYIAILNGAGEAVPNASLASGFATFTLNGDSLDVLESFTGLSTPASGAHIHCCAPAGSTAMVAVPFVGFPSATAGTYAHTFDLTSLATYTSGFITLEGGTAAGAEAALIAGFSSGLDYANIHDSTFPGGEIRGTITPTPEPGGLVLLGTGMIGMLQAVRRKVRA